MDWKIIIFMFVINKLRLFANAQHQFRIEPPILSSVFTTERTLPIVNKQFFIHSAPEDDNKATVNRNDYSNYRNKQNRPYSYRIFFITLPKLLDSKTKFATQTSDGTVVYILNRKGIQQNDDDDGFNAKNKQQNNLISSITAGGRFLVGAPIILPSLTRSKKKPTAISKQIEKNKFLAASTIPIITTTTTSTTTTTNAPELEPTHGSEEPEIITAHDNLETSSDYVDYTNDYENESLSGIPRDSNINVSGRDKNDNEDDDA